MKENLRKVIDSLNFSNYLHHYYTLQLQKMLEGRIYTMFTFQGPMTFQELTEAKIKEGSYAKSLSKKHITSDIHAFEKLFMIFLERFP